PRGEDPDEQLSGEPAGHGAARLGAGRVEAATGGKLRRAVRGRCHGDSVARVLRAVLESGRGGGVGTAGLARTAGLAQRRKGRKGNGRARAKTQRTQRAFSLCT